MKKKKKRRAIIDLNAADGSRDIPSQSQEIERDGHCHFVSFKPLFHINMTSQTKFGKIMKN